VAIKQAWRAPHVLPRPEPGVRGSLSAGRHGITRLRRASRSYQFFLGVLAPWRL